MLNLKALILALKSLKKTVEWLNTREYKKLHRTNFKTFFKNKIKKLVFNYEILLLYHEK